MYASMNVEINIKKASLKYKKKKEYIQFQSWEL